MPVLKLHTADFIAALKRVKPKRMTVADRAGELYLGKNGDEAVFCVRGALTRCPIIEGDWEGVAAVTFGMIASFLKAPPPGPTISLKHDGEHLKVDSLTLRSTWAAAPPWIAAMATEAHLLNVDDTPRQVKLFCPRCGKRKGEPWEATARDWPQGLLVATALSREHANMRCSDCGHAWCEIGIVN